MSSIKRVACIMVGLGMMLGAIYWLLPDKGFFWQLLGTVVLLLGGVALIVVGAV